MMRVLRESQNSSSFFLKFLLLSKENSSKEESARIQIERKGSCWDSSASFRGVVRCAYKNDDPELRCKRPERSQPWRGLILHWEVLARDLLKMSRLGRGAHGATAFGPASLSVLVDQRGDK
jgi:hypothetical protein